MRSRIWPSCSVSSRASSRMSSMRSLSFTSPVPEVSSTPTMRALPFETEASRLSALRLRGRPSKVTEPLPWASLASMERVTMARSRNTVTARMVELGSRGRAGGGV
jgi:hypothetical protein